MNRPPIVSSQEWEAARQKLLVKEKEVTRARDALAAQRRRMPALGRQEEWEDSPSGYPQSPPYQWWNYHDAY